MKRFLPVILLTLPLLVQPGAALGAGQEGADPGRNPPGPPRPPAAASGPKNSLKLTLSRPLSLSYVLANEEFHVGETLLILGARPVGDRPASSPAALGQPLTPQDWILEDPPAAAWVTGVPAPEPGRPIVLMARPEKREGPTLQRAVQVLTLGKGKTLALRTGESVFVSLPGSKSNTCPVELIGDSVEIVYHDPFESVILKAVKPGASRLKVFSVGWQSTEVQLIREYDVTVE